jgi:hypothetical protein
MDKLQRLADKFKARYESYKLLKGYTHTAKAWKRAWLDVLKEIRKDS